QPSPELLASLEAQGLRIVAPMEAGASPLVFKVRDVAADRLQVLKLLPEDLRRHASYAYDFRVAAERLGRIDIPGLTHVFRVVEGPTWLGALVEFVDGEDLGRVLGREGRVPPDRAVRIAEAVSLTLFRACARNIHHGDLRPSSVMLAPGGAVRLLGVGLPHPIPIAPPGASPNDVPYGIPLERLFWAPPSPVRCDLYRLGFLLYHMIVGVPPMAHANVNEVMFQLRRKDWPSLRRVLPDAPLLLERVVVKLGDRAEGYPGFEELLHDLERLRVELPERARPAPEPEDRVTRAMATVAGEAPLPVAPVAPAPRPPSRLRLPMALAASAALGIGLVGPVFRMRQPPPTPPPATVLLPAATEVEGGILAAADGASDAEQAFRRAVRLYEADPADTAGAVRRFREVVSSWPDTKWAAEAEVRVGEAYRRAEADLDVAWERARKQVDVLAEWEDFGEAIAHIDAFLGERPDTRYTPEAKELRKQVEEKGTAWAKAAYGEGRALMAEGKWEEARTKLSRVAQLALSQMSRDDASAGVKRCDEALADVDTRRREKERAAKQEVLEAELARVCGKVREAFEEFDFAGGAEAARTFRDAVDAAEFPTVAARAAALALAAGAADGARAAAVHGINAAERPQPPGMYGPSRMAATIVSATTERVTLRLVDADATVALAWEDLGIKQALDVFLRFAAEGDADTAVGLGLVAHVHGEDGWADKRFQNAAGLRDSAAADAEWMKRAMDRSGARQGAGE
ncbi:MAG: hypothetical protein AAB434_02205, partial [Planctomycetota bacterium]